MMKHCSYIISLLLSIVSFTPANAQQVFVNRHNKESNGAVVTTRNLELAKTAKGEANQVITHVGYTTSYNLNRLIPNWFAYEITAREAAGTYPRPKKQFEPAPMMKGRSAEHRDYTNSGYSRGHMAPAADRKWSEQPTLESFYLSNICPQIAELNGGIWENLENRVRKLTSDSNVYVCCDPIVSSYPKHIGENRVAIPAKFFSTIP